MKTSLNTASSGATSQIDESSESSIIKFSNSEKKIIELFVAVILSRCGYFINLSSSILKSFAEGFY